METPSTGLNKLLHRHVDTYHRHLRIYLYGEQTLRKIEKCVEKQTDRVNKKSNEVVSLINGDTIHRIK
jgi:hypothetical protein